MRTFGYTLAFMIGLAGAGQALAASQPDSRPAGQVIWFQPSQVIIDGTLLIETGETDKVIEGMSVIRREMERDLDFGDVISGRNNLCVGHLLLQQFQEVPVANCFQQIPLPGPMVLVYVMMHHRHRVLPSI